MIASAASSNSWPDTLLAAAAPMLHRAHQMDAGTLARVEVRAGTGTVLLRLPFDVLVSRAVAVPERTGTFNATARAGDLLGWLEGTLAGPLQRRDTEWRGGRPPLQGWRRVDTVPEQVVRDLVQQGKRTLDAATGSRPPRALTNALLDTVVLTVSAEDQPDVPVTLRSLTALVRMGFVPPGSHVAVDTAGRWQRVAARFGSAYAERADSLLRVL
jgi:hypothetical protein